MKDRILARGDLRPYQQYAVERIKEDPFLGLWLDCGLGKSVSALTAARDLLDEFVVNKVLIVAPLYVANNTWPEELCRWSHLQPLTHSVVTGSAKQRERAARSDAEVHIINRENIPWLWEFWGDKWPYDMVIWDESSGLKNPRKRTPKGRFTRFGALCRARKHIRRMVQLTGTPAPNGLMDLWAQIYALDGGERLGRSFHAFRNRWFESDYMGYTWTPRPNAYDEIMGRIKDITVSMRSEDYLQLPERIDNIVRVKLPEKVLAEYHRLERDMVLDEIDVEAVNRGVLTGKLVQLANGSVYNTEKSAHPFHTEKLGALERIIEEAQGQPILIAYSFQFDLEQLRKKFPQLKTLDDGDDIVAQWNDGKIPLLAVHPASAGHGLNLQHGGHIAVWYGLTWSLELYQQFNKRLHRSGQQESVILHHIIAEGTADEDVLEAMRRKDAVQSAVTEIVRARIRNHA